MLVLLIIQVKQYKPNFWKLFFLGPPILASGGLSSGFAKNNVHFKIYSNLKHIILWLLFLNTMKRNLTEQGVLMHMPLNMWNLCIVKVINTVHPHYTLIHLWFTHM